MRTIYLFIFFFSGLSASFAQQSPDWTLYQSNAGVEIYYQQTDCRTDVAPAQIAYIIKVVNTTSNACVVEWDLAVWYNNEKLTHDIADGENHASIVLAGNETVQGTCENPSGHLYVFKDFITYVSPTKLTRFELENITVSKN